jgi:cell division protein FtsW
MNRSKPDYWLILLTFILLGFGLIMVFSASYYIGITNAQFNDPYFFIKKQLSLGLIGLLLFFIFSYIPYPFYRKQVGIILFFCLVLLLIVLIPGIGVVRNGARRWLDLGLFSFQPSELVKLGMVIYTASIMTKKQPILHRFRRAILPPLIVIVLICSLLVVEPHFSTTIILLVTCITIIFCAGARLRHLCLLALIGLPILIGVMISGEYRVDRLVTLFNPMGDPDDKGYQIIQSLLAIGPGGITGNGLGGSIQKLAYLPEAHTDFIFSIVAEELGFIGGAFLICLFTLLIVRGIFISLQCPDQFGILLGIGIVTLFAVETISNLGVVTGLLPVTGVPLPLISYGGTFLMIKLVQLGILLNLSRHRVQKTKGKTAKTMQTISTSTATSLKT